jgi:hypothetical protein
MIEQGGVAMVNGFPVRAVVTGPAPLMAKDSSNTRSGSSTTKRGLAPQRRPTRRCDTRIVPAPPVLGVIGVTLARPSGYYAPLLRASSGFRSRTALS